MKKARLDLRRTCRLIRGCGYAVPTPVRCCPPEEKIQKDYYLRPPRLRRNTAFRNASSSGQHSLIGGELSGAGLYYNTKISHVFQYLVLQLYRIDAPLIRRGIRVGVFAEFAEDDVREEHVVAQSKVLL